MSKWTEVRDGLVSALDVNEVAEAAKDQLTASLINDGMPTNSLHRFRPRRHLKPAGMRFAINLCCQS